VTATCPAGHRSTTLDYCGQCGIPMRGDPADGASVTIGASEGPRARPESRSTRSCPNCAAVVADSATCAECGFRFDAPDSVAVWEEQHWDVVARHDRQYFDMVDPEGIEFPDEVVSRRIPLLGDHIRIGRRSKTKDIFPEIDLSGSLEDVGVSHRHAVLLRQAAGNWALTDAGSTNGTYLNAEQDPLPANERVPLRDGDQIHIGAWTTLTIERVDASDTHSAEVELPSKDTRGMARTRGSSTSRCSDRSRRRCRDRSCRSARPRHVASSPSWPSASTRPCQSATSSGRCGATRSLRPRQGPAGLHLDVAQVPAANVIETTRRATAWSARRTSSTCSALSGGRTEVGSCSPRATPGRRWPRRLGPSSSGAASRSPTWWTRPSTPARSCDCANAGRVRRRTSSRGASSSAITRA